MTRRRAASMAARSRSSRTPSAWARAASESPAARASRPRAVLRGLSPSGGAPIPRRGAARPTTKRKRFTGWPGATSSMRRRICGAEISQLVGPDRRRALHGELRRGGRPWGARRPPPARRRRAPRRRTRAPGRCPAECAAERRRSRMSPSRRGSSVAAAGVRRRSQRVQSRGGAGAAVVGRRRRRAGRQRAVQRQLDHGRLAPAPPP